MADDPSDDAMHDRLMAAGVRWRHASADGVAHGATSEVAVLTEPVRTRHWLSMMAAAAVVAALALGVLIFAHDRGSTTHPVPATEATLPLTGVTWTDPNSLTGAWTLSRRSSGLSTRSALSLSRLVLDGDGGFAMQHRCYTNQGTAAVDGGSVTLAHVTLKIAIPCASNAETPAGQREDGIVDTELSGTVQWTATGSTLTIVGGADTLTFTKDGVLAPVASTSPPSGLTPANTPATPIADSAALIGQRWSLTRIEQTSGGRVGDSAPSAMTVFAFRRRSVTAPYRQATAVGYGQSVIDFAGAWAVGGVADPIAMTPEQQRLVFTRLLRGRVRWAIEGDTLTMTMTKSGVGVLVFSRA